MKVSYCTKKSNFDNVIYIYGLNISDCSVFLFVYHNLDLLPFVLETLFRNAFTRSVYL